MIAVDVVGLVTVLTATDPAACDQVALPDLASTVNQVHSWLDSYDARIAMRATEFAAAGVGDSAAVVLGDRGRRSGKAAREAASRGGVCTDLPGVFDALASGAVSAGHVDAIARLAGKLDDAGGWTLALKPDRTITLRRPDGSLSYEGVTTDRSPARPGESEIPEHLRRAARTIVTSSAGDHSSDDPPERSASP